MKIREKAKNLSEVISIINKQFGEGAVMKLGNVPEGAEVPSFHSGSLGLNTALGVGGYPRGRIIEIFGPESSGKTTLTLHAIAEVQRAGGVAAFVDAEHALDVGYAQKLGVNADELLVAQPDYGEQALEITDRLINSGKVELVVIDSVAALTPKAELEGEMGDHHVGLQARMMSQAMRKLTAIAYQTGSSLIFINQIRHKIGVKFGSPETTTGGNALKFYASVRLDVRQIGKILDKEGKDQVGVKTLVKVVKNKMAPPFRHAEFEIRFGDGIFQCAEVLDHAVAKNLVQKSGAHYSLEGNHIGHGRDAAVAHLAENRETLSTLINCLTENKGNKPGDDVKPKPGPKSDKAA